MDGCLMRIYDNLRHFPWDMTQIMVCCRTNKSKINLL